MHNVVVEVHILNFIFGKVGKMKHCVIIKITSLEFTRFTQNGATSVFYLTVDYIDCTIVNCKYN